MNYADVKSERHRKHFIYKSESGGFLCIFSSSFCFVFFVSDPQFSKSNPCIENLFLCCSVLEFNSFLTLAFFYLVLSVDADFVAQSLASGTVEE